MFSDFMNAVQGMNSMVLTVFFACLGIVYFMFIKPTLENAKEMQKLQTSKLNSLPSEADIAKLLQTTIGNVPTAVTNVEQKVDKLLTAIADVNEDLAVHSEEESSVNDQQTELLESLHTNTSNIETIVEHLILELSKNKYISTINKDELDAMRSVKSNLNQMLAFIDHQMKTQSKTTKLNRVMNTRI